MDQFEQYEMEFTHKAAALRQRINQVGSFQGEKKKVVLTELEIQLDTLQETLNKMEHLAKGGSSQRGRNMQQKVRSCNSELSRLQRDLQHATLVSSSSSSTTAQQREGLFGYDAQSKELDHRRQILSGTQTLEESGSHLNNAHRIAVETEGIGTSVLSEMGGQRRQLEGVRDNLGIIDDNMTRSRKVLSSMTRRIATNKLILAFIILILLLANGLIIYFKWIAKLVK